MICLSSGSVSAQNAPRECPDHRAIEAIRAVKKPNTPRERMARAREVDKLLMQNPSCGSPDVVAELIKLLRDLNGGVRYWSAMALGDVGPTASAAIPALEEALNNEPKVPASQFPVTRGYLFALKRIREAAQRSPPAEPSQKDLSGPSRKGSEMERENEQKNTRPTK